MLYVCGRPVLSDPGLVVDESEAASLVGTPGYVPPEKFTAAASDVYSLGLALKAASFGRQIEDIDKTSFPLGASGRENPDKPAAEKSRREICCGPVYPRLNVGNEHPPLDCRLLTWQQYAENCDGVFNWGVNYWHNRTLTDDSDVYLKDWNVGSGMSGDGLMFYPGKSGPLPTIRLANVRDGVQDYELMKLAEANSGREAVLEVVRRISPGQTHPNRDWRELRHAWVYLVRLATATKFKETEYELK